MSNFSKEYLTVRIKNHLFLLVEYAKPVSLLPKMASVHKLVQPCRIAKLRMKCLELLALNVRKTF